MKVLKLVMMAPEWTHWHQLIICPLGTSNQGSISVPPENVRKVVVFWRF